MFQFARPRGERRLRGQNRTAIPAVSIRAPAWGATVLVHLAETFSGVSIRAPAWGATCPGCAALTSGCRFNSRSRVGSDTSVATGAAREARFQFALPRGERRKQVLFATQNPEFQFALPRGERRRRCNAVVKIIVFQFALPRGERRYPVSEVYYRFQVSIRAPAWGATLGEGHRDQRALVSIRAPAWGATEALRMPLMSSVSFNSRSRVGSDWRPCSLLP